MEKRRTNSLGKIGGIDDEIQEKNKDAKVNQPTNQNAQKPINQSPKPKPMPRAASIERQPKEPPKPRSGNQPVPTGKVQKNDYIEPNMPKKLDGNMPIKKPIENPKPLSEPSRTKPVGRPMPGSGPVSTRTPPTTRTRVVNFMCNIWLFVQFLILPKF